MTVLDSNRPTKQNTAGKDPKYYMTAIIIFTRRVIVRMEQFWSKGPCVSRLAHARSSINDIKVDSKVHQVVNTSKQSITLPYATPND